MQKLVEGRRVDAAHRLAPVDDALVDEGDRAGERSGRRALRSAGLEQVETVVLDRELDVLHVAVVTLERVDGLLELPVGTRERVAHAGDRLGRARAGDDILTLGVDEELAVQARWPVAGLRLKQTPVAERTSRLPNTISITLTAVPSSSEMGYSWR